MKKILSILLAAVLAFGLTACAKDSEPPVIEGVVDSAQIAQGESFNALENVTAKDDKDGDITDKIVLSSEPNLEFKDGVATRPHRVLTRSSIPSRIRPAMKATHIRRSR